jgi:hypothetical protein
MGLTATSSGDDFEVVPVGTHSAICYKLAEAGTREEQYQDDAPKKRKSVFMFWELPALRTKNDQPFSIFKQYTLSLNENAALHKDLKSWRGKSFTEDELKGFDLTNILGVTCDLEVGHTVNGKAKVVSIFKPDGGAKKVATVNDQVAFDLDEYCKEFSGQSCESSKAACDVFADLPVFLCDMIDASFEMAAAHAKGSKADGGLVKGLAAISSTPQPVAEDQFVDDDIPF